MEYSIKELADLAGISTRTLRYYDEIGLLKPSQINSSGYRVYESKEVDLLQQILLYKSMDMKLEDIQKIISHGDYDVSGALIEHKRQLIHRRNQLDRLITTVEKTIAHNKGEISMTNAGKFEGFKKEKLTQNEKNFGKEIRENYGEETIKKSNKNFMNLSEEDYMKMQKAETQIFDLLKEVVRSKDLESESAQGVYNKHKYWLSFTWETYSPQAHIALAQMYAQDERFRKYYNDRAGEEVVSTLLDIIVKYAK